MASGGVCHPHDSLRSSACSGRPTVRYLLKMSRAASASGRSILIFTSSRPGAENRRVDHVLAVGGADHDDVLETFDAVDLESN